MTDDEMQGERKKTIDFYSIISSTMGLQVSFSRFSPLRNLDVVQVCSLMWVQAVMNYQYRHGGTTTTAFATLWRQGGIRRLYIGFGPALLQGPLARFGDTAANVALLALLDGTQVLTL